MDTVLIAPGMYRSACDPGTADPGPVCPLQ
jgi:hypothetical protein